MTLMGERLSPPSLCCCSCCCALRVLAMKRGNRIDAVCRSSPRRRSSSWVVSSWRVRRSTLCCSAVHSSRLDSASLCMTAISWWHAFSSISISKNVS